MMGPELPMSVDLTEDPAPATFLAFSILSPEPLEKKQLPCLSQSKQTKPQEHTGEKILARDVYIVRLVCFSVLPH